MLGAELLKLVTSAAHTACVFGARQSERRTLALQHGTEPTRSASPVSRSSMDATVTVRRTGSALGWYADIDHDDVVALLDQEESHGNEGGPDGEDAGSFTAVGQQGPGGLGLDRGLME